MGGVGGPPRQWQWRRRDSIRPHRLRRARPKTVRTLLWWWKKFYKFVDVYHTNKTWVVNKEGKIRLNMQVILVSGVQYLKKGKAKPHFSNQTGYRNNVPLSHEGIPLGGGGCLIMNGGIWWLKRGTWLWWKKKTSLLGLDLAKGVHLHYVFLVNVWWTNFIVSCMQAWVEF